MRPPHAPPPPTTGGSTDPTLRTRLRTGTDVPGGMIRASSGLSAERTADLIPKVPASFRPYTAGSQMSDREPDPLGRGPALAFFPRSHRVGPCPGRCGGTPRGGE